MQSIHKTDHLCDHISDQTIEGNVVIMVKKKSTACPDCLTHMQLAVE